MFVKYYTFKNIYEHILTTKQSVRQRTGGGVENPLQALPESNRKQLKATGKFLLFTYDLNS